MFFSLVLIQKKQKIKNKRFLHSCNPALRLLIPHEGFYKHIFCKKMKSSVFINIPVLSKLFGKLYLAINRGGKKIKVPNINGIGHFDF